MHLSFESYRKKGVLTNQSTVILAFIFTYAVFFFFLFRAAPAVSRSSQARGSIRATASGLRHSHSDTRSLTHWARPGIKSASSEILVRFVTAEPQGELLYGIFFIHSSVTGRLGCFYVLAIVNSAAVNTGVHVAFQIMVFCIYAQKWDCWVLW